MTEQQVEEATVLVERYIQRSLGLEVAEPLSPLDETLWRVGQEVFLENTTAFTAFGALDMEPYEILAVVSERVAMEGGLNWGRVITLVVYASTLAQTNRNQPGNPRELAAIVSQFVVREYADWFQSSGRWDGFQRFFAVSDSIRGKSHFSSALMAAAGVGLAGLVFLLTVR